MAEFVASSELWRYREKDVIHNGDRWSIVEIF